MLDGIHTSSPSSTFVFFMRAEKMEAIA